MRERDERLGGHKGRVGKKATEEGGGLTTTSDIPFDDCPTQIPWMH